MRVLLSAIACQPGMGSEAKVGWDAALAISERHECHVMTHSVGRNAIEQLQSAGGAADVRFHYFGEPFSYHQNRFIARLQSWLIYRKWQAKLLPFAEELHRRHRFDLAQHLTYVTWRVAPPLWRLPVPFVWGPIGGTSEIPRAFFGILSPAARTFETARFLSAAVATRSRSFRDCVTNSAVVVAGNQETKDFLRRFRPTRPVARLWPVFFTPEQASALRAAPRSPSNPGQPLQLFAGGNLEGRKGVALALETIALLKGRGVRVKYTFGGGGPELRQMESMAERLGLKDEVEFHPGFEGRAYIDKLGASDVYFLPSFRETSPITLLEAILAGCYPVVADTSGAGEIVCKVGGHAVPAHDREGLVAGLAEALRWCGAHRGEMTTRAAAASQAVASSFSRERYVAGIDAFYAEALEASRGARA